MRWRAWIRFPTSSTSDPDGRRRPRTWQFELSGAAARRGLSESGDGYRRGLQEDVGFLEHAQHDAPVGRPGLVLRSGAPPDVIPRRAGAVLVHQGPLEDIALLDAHVP